jgi:hypothetical protein
MFSLLILLINLVSSQLEAKEGYHHFPEIFAGATHADGETNFTYALEYEYKFSANLGAGVIYEKVDDAHHGDGITLQIASLYYHPVSSGRLGLGLGKERVGGSHPHTEDLVRVSASYDYHFEGFSIAPTIALDSVNGESATVFGLGFIKPF